MAEIAPSSTSSPNSCEPPPMKNSHLESLIESLVAEEYQPDDDEEDVKDSPELMVDEDNILVPVPVDMNQFKDIEFDLNEDANGIEFTGDFDDFDSLSDSDNEPPMQRAMRRTRKKQKASTEGINCPFFVGQCLPNRDVIKSMVKQHAIDTRRQLHIKKNDNIRFRVVCLGSNPKLTCKDNSKSGGESNKNMEPTCPWKGQLYKDLLWKCATSTSTQWFVKAMEEVLQEDKALHDWLKDIGPEHWSRAHFSGMSKCDALLNNFCEVFNRQLIGGRDKPIITCLEYIRQYLMKRIVVVRKMIEKCEGPLTPAATKILERIVTDASQYRARWNGGSKYDDGIPCRHAMACIFDMGLHGHDDGIIEKWVDKAYWLDTWEKVYSNTIGPINGPDLWKSSECLTTIISPKYHTPIGRPKKKRKKSAEEISELSQRIGSGGKMSKTGNTVTCDMCKEKGHNKRTCKKKD